MSYLPQVRSSSLFSTLKFFLTPPPNLNKYPLCLVTSLILDVLLHLREQFEQPLAAERLVPLDERHADSV